VRSLKILLLILFCLTGVAVTLPVSWAQKTEQAAVSTLERTAQSQFLWSCADTGWIWI